MTSLKVPSLIVLALAFVAPSAAHDARCPYETYQPTEIGDYYLYTEGDVVEIWAESNGIVTLQRENTEHSYDGKPHVCAWADAQLV